MGFMSIKFSSIFGGENEPRTQPWREFFIELLGILQILLNNAYKPFFLTNNAYKLMCH